MKHAVAFDAGDSITIAPAQTLTDKEYQRLRDAAVAIIREMGVECGGSNVQVELAVNGLAVQLPQFWHAVVPGALSSYQGRRLDAARALPWLGGHNQQQACSQVCLVVLSKRSAKNTQTACQSG